MALENPLSTTVVVLASRRRSPRLPPGDRLGVEIVSILVPARLVDISVGGFAVELPCSLRIGAVHQFRFVTAGGRTVELPARIVHSRRKGTPDSSESYVSGCEFLHDAAADTDRLVDELISAAMGGRPPQEAS
jgi:hypothetical protein